VEHPSAEAFFSDIAGFQHFKSGNTSIAHTFLPENCSRLLPHDTSTGQSAGPGGLLYELENLIEPRRM
jgi:hypothetical protein